MNWQQILDKFYLQAQDSSELSSVEALDLLNDIYWDVQDDRAWEWLKTTYTGTTSTTVPYISLPTDFKYLVPNYNWVGTSFTNLWVPVGYSSNPLPTNIWNITVVFRGTNRNVYQVIPFSEKDNYYNINNYCYIDLVNSRLYFTVQPTLAESVTYTYIKVAPDVTVSTSPIFRAGFHNIIAYWMAANFNVLQMTDKAQSYRMENLQLYNDTLLNMQMEDAHQKLWI